MLEIDGKAHAQPITFCLDPHPLKLKDFPSWKPQVFVSCNKSIRTKQANPSTDTAISMGNDVVCWIKTKIDGGENCH